MCSDGFHGDKLSGSLEVEYLVACSEATKFSSLIIVFLTDECFLKGLRCVINRTCYF
jgi:hypothetical protein